MITCPDGPSGAPPGCSTLVDLLRARAHEQPEQRAYTLLVDGEAEEVHRTYGELEQQVRAIAAGLRDLGAAGGRALLLCPPGLDYVAGFFGCLYAGVTAVPAYPPRPNRSLERLQAIVDDAQATLALSTARSIAALERRAVDGPVLEGVRWLAVDRLPDGAESSWREPELTPETLAFLQYTSGSTGTPRGVMVSHANVLHNLGVIARSYRLTPSERGVTWLPPYHDLGLVGGLLTPLFLGFPAAIMSPVAFLQRPARWLHAMTRYHATVSVGPTFAFDLCVRRTRPEEREAFDLSAWAVACIGGEPVRHEILERFVEVFSPRGFRREALGPGYGLAEATMFFSGSGPDAPPVVRTVLRSALEDHRVVDVPADHPGALTLVGCGQNLSDQGLAIVHPERLTRCGPDEVGEIWIAGPSVAGGYWNRPLETDETFRACLADSGEGPFLRTGDLGFVWDGELFITGRIKDLIIIRGRNHYPQDIERTVEESHPSLCAHSGAAFSVEVDGAEQLVVVQEVDRQWRDSDPSEVTWAIRQAVSERHEVELYAVLLLKPGSIPKTSSGKIRRRACRSGFLDGSLEAWGARVPEARAAEPSADSSE